VRKLSLAVLALTLFAPMFASAASCPSLSRGMSGPNVSAVQQVLYNAYQGFPTPTGYFGAVTERALKQWQREHGLEAVGYVGPKTAAAMKLSLCPNAGGNTSQGGVTSGSAASPTLPTTSTSSSQSDLIKSLLAQVAALQARIAALASGTQMQQTQTVQQQVQVATQSPSTQTQIQTTDQARTPIQNQTQTPAQPADCILNGTTVASGRTTTAYQNASVPFGQQCVSEQRTCSNGTLSGSYTNTSCAVQAQTYPTMPVVAQTQVVGGNNLYSPFGVLFNGALRLYFGGWLSAGQTNDNIYVADCPSPTSACGAAQKVMDAVASGLIHVNDPTIVLHPGSPAYYIMYLTGYNSAGSNDIYYATSWATDGLTWSAPTRLISGYWLPSAVWKNDHVELWANSTTDGAVRKFDLGSSGIGVGAPTTASFDNAPSVPPFYSNVDVVWRPTLNAYQMVAERALSTTPGAASVIDYLSSTDGVSWHLQYPSIIAAAPGQFRVGTPSQHPDTAQYVYFGSTAQQDSMGFKINFAQWTAP
jgi:peptidoglycan hydrolase-like protein with peptidoglycan-binding domain